jgi:serine/threonine-protein kinase HipA
MHELALAVRLQEEEIGRLIRFPDDRFLFSFAEDYIQATDRSVLSLSFKAAPSAAPNGGRHDVVTSLRAYHTRVPPFFANLLPEGRLRSYLARRAGLRERDDFGLIAAVGTDLPGAVTVVPVGMPPAHPAQGEGEPSGPLRFSLAGVQLKVSAQIDKAGRFTMRADGGGGQWVVKLPAAAFPGVSENEFAMLALARAVGIEVPETRLLSPQEITNLPRGLDPAAGKALAVRRFDRGPSGHRIHIEDFAQVFGLYPEDKYKKKSYANIAAVLAAEAGSRSVDAFMRRLVFSVIIGNGDMHLKNWSLIYRDGRSPDLSPAYDFLSTVPYLPNDGLGLTFGGERSLSGVTHSQVRRLAERARVAASPLWSIAVETVERTLRAWETLEERSVMPGWVGEAINRQIRRVCSHRLAP